MWTWRSNVHWLFFASYLLVSQSPGPTQTQWRQDNSALLTAPRTAETSSQQTWTLQKGHGKVLCVNCSERLWSRAARAQLCLLNYFNVQMDSTAADLFQSHCSCIIIPTLPKSASRDCWTFKSSLVDKPCCTVTKVEQFLILMKGKETP